MKKILVICGTGVATSTIALKKLKEWANENNYENLISFAQSKISEAMGKVDEYDIIISTTIVPDSISHKVIDGLSLITGIDTSEFFEQVAQRING